MWQNPVHFDARKCFIISGAFAVSQAGRIHQVLPLIEQVLGSFELREPFGIWRERGSARKVGAWNYLEPRFIRTTPTSMGLIDCTDLFIQLQSWALHPYPVFAIPNSSGLQ